MKQLNTHALVALALFISGLMLGACVSTQIDTRLPENHPANPAAEAAVFVPPSNPFATNAFDTQLVRPPAASGDHPKHREDTGHGHGRDGDGRNAVNVAAHVRSGQYPADDDGPRTFRQHRDGGYVYGG